MTREQYMKATGFYFKNMKRTAWKTQITGNVDNLKPISENR